MLFFQKLKYQYYRLCCCVTCGQLKDKFYQKKLNTKNKLAQILINHDLIYNAICRQSYTNQRLILASVVNKKAFSEYKACFRGKDIVLIAAGPTVNDFVPVKNSIYVGCNRAFLLDNIKFDFLFAIDKVGIQNCYNEFFNYEKENCTKFIGDQNLGVDYQIPEDIIPINNKIHRYITNAGISTEISYYPLDIYFYFTIIKSSNSIPASNAIHSLDSTQKNFHSRS